MTVDDLKRRYDYGYWANERIFAIIAQLTPEEFAQGVAGGWGSIRNTLVHTMSAECLASCWSMAQTTPYITAARLRSCFACSGTRPVISICSSTMLSSVLEPIRNRVDAVDSEQAGELGDAL